VEGKIQQPGCRSRVVPSVCGRHIGDRDTRYNGGPHTATARPDTAIVAGALVVRGRVAGDGHPLGLEVLLRVAGEP
jgi:hypothetical protein